MKICNRILSLLLMTAMVISMAGCSSGDVSYAMVINGEQMTPGIYVGYLTSALIKGHQNISLTSSTKDVWDQKVEDVPLEDWVKAEALRNIKRNEGAKILADQMGISLDESDIQKAETALKYMWETSGSLYEESGCSYKSALEIYKDNFLADKVFTALYGEGAKDAPSDEEIQKAFDDNYAYINIISLNYYNEDGMRVDDEEIAKRNAHFEDMIKRVKAGENYNDLLIEHGKWINETYNTDSFDEKTFVPEENYSIIYKDDTSISEQVRKAVFEIGKGEATTIDQDPVVYLVYRTDLPDDEETMNTYLNSVLKLLKQDEFDAKCLAAAEDVEIVVNEEAVSYYSPKNIKYDFS